MHVIICLEHFIFIIYEQGLRYIEISLISRRRKRNKEHEAYTLVYIHLNQPIISSNFYPYLTFVEGGKYISIQFRFIICNGYQFFFLWPKLRAAKLLYVIIIFVTSFDHVSGIRLVFFNDHNFLLLLLIWVLFLFFFCL